MKAIRRNILSVLTLLMAIVASSAFSQTFPSRPIRLVAPFPAGGTADAIARAVGNQVGEQLGQSFVIDNRSGANGIIGTDIVAKAAPDGHTILHITGSFVINPSIYRKLPYDIFKDFVPVTNIVLGDGYLLLANPSLPVNSVKDLVALSKKGTPLNFSSPGVGNTLHLAGALFNVRAGTKLAHVPYKGVAPAMNAVLGGEVHVTFMPPTVAMPHVKAGKLKALGFTGGSRWSGMPDLPTMAESGIPQFELSGSWHGWFAPAGTPAKIVNTLQSEAKKALQVSSVRGFIVAGGYQPDGRSSQEFGALVRSEFKRYAEMVQIAGVPQQ
jgi:tripartite-type tricarboxylate transporter receptor subunit TctC